MIRRAILYLADPEDRAAASTPVLGFTLAFRALAAAVRAGASEVFVPAMLKRPALERALASRPAIAARVRWLGDDAAPPDGSALLMPAAALAPPAAIARLLAARAPAVLVASEEHAAPIVLAPAALVADLGPALAVGLPVGDDLTRALKSLEVVRVATEGWYARTPGEEALTAHLGRSAIDTSLDRAFHRRLSRPLSRLAIAWGVAPNVVSLASLGIGSIAAACFWHATPVTALVGLALYAASVVLDHTDGEVARLALAESALGAWLDVLNDTIVHALLVLAMAITVSITWAPATLVGIAGTLGVIASALAAKLAPPASGAAGSVLHALGTRDGFYALLILFVLGLTLSPAALPALLVVLALGSNTYWLLRLVHGALSR
ncbi:MAG: CDP-alcohol phosphatidyltransferase family protein [Candidatus Rokubacteria bacterium]|nr:CDP-alcohol phosphatidyltransferase family protein [Candidatus Rokubacteria bacterium]MBI3826631.1 CDP-alcohol phosphatidyltransferase family protein [Candidatus Rokubacteria bacterium]